MIEVARVWFKRYFSDPQAVVLAVLLVVGFTVVLTMGNMLAPVLASVVIAYLLEGIVAVLQRHGVQRLPAVFIVFSAFFAFLVILLLGATPLIWAQITELFKELPKYVAEGQSLLLRLPEVLPFISEEQVREISAAIRADVHRFGQRILTLSLASIPGIITLLVYLVLLPLLVFFFLKDKALIVDWIKRHLPSERTLAAGVWQEMDQQIGNYVRGKIWEILIIGITTYVVFSVMGLKYALLLGALVGLSVVVPYVGAAVVTLPVAFIAYFQWGWTADFAYLMLAYGIIQAVDGNVLVPLLFSEVVNLHPVAIIVAILVFGGLWGFWGVFFAIPLATLVSALLRAWPRVEVEEKLAETVQAERAEGAE